MSCNAAQFLGHLPGRRCTRGPVPIGPGTLLVVDEASMLSGPDPADLIASAKARGAKIILAGYISQLQAVETAAACPCSPPGRLRRPVAGGTDTLLMAADHALRRELNRRIHDNLITLGIAQNGRAVTIADDTRASPSDLIICTRNDHTAEAGEPGRMVANGDLLRIDAITPDGLSVRRALDADPAPGQW